MSHQSTAIPATAGLSERMQDLSHKNAAKFLCRDPKVLNDLRKLGISHPDWKEPERRISDSIYGKPAWHYTMASLAVLKPCMETGDVLSTKGIVKPDGHLWILQETKAGAAIVDLGKSSGPIYSIK